MSMRWLASVVFLVAWIGSCLTFYTTLSQDRFLRGADAYYYAVQTKYYATTGKVKIPDSSPVHRLTGFLQRRGLSTEQALRLWLVASLFFFGLSSGGLVCLSRRWEILSSFLLLALLISPSTLFTAIEFPKMFSWMIFVPVWFYPLVRLGRYWGWSILIALGSCLFHRAGIPVAVLFSSVLIFFRRSHSSNIFLRHPRPNGSMLSGDPEFGPPLNEVKGGAGATGYWKIGLPLFVIFLVLIYLIGFNDRLHLFDLNRLSWNQLNLGIFSLFLRENLPIAIKIELFLAPAIFIFIAMRFWRTPLVNRWEILLPCSLILPAFFPLGSQEVFHAGERYAIFFPSFLLVGSLFLATRLPKKNWNWLLGLPWVAAGLALLFLSPLRLELSHPLRLDPDFQSDEQVVLELKKIDLPMLIAQKNLVYFYDFQLTREAFPYEPEDHWNKTRVWRLLYKIFPEELNYYLEDRCKWEGGLLKSLSAPDYTLIREDCWESMRSKITFEENSDLYHRAWESWLNPSKKRPIFLYPKHRDDAGGEFSATPPDKAFPPLRGGD